MVSYQDLVIYHDSVVVIFSSLCFVVDVRFASSCILDQTNRERPVTHERA